MPMLSSYVPGLDALELLVGVSRTGSLSRAGAERGVSQPAASMRVKSIETQVGVRLVERGPSGSRLTPAGSLLADWAADVLRAAERLDAGITSLRETRSTHLRIASSLTIAEQLLPAWITALRGWRPTTAVSLAAVNSTAVAELVLTRQAELGFVEGPDIPSGLTTRQVGVDTLLLVCAPASPLARRARRPLTADELAALPLVEREAGSGTRASLDAALAAAVTPLSRPTPLLEVSSTTAIRAAVTAGVGPAVVSSLAVQDDLAGRHLIQIPVVGIDLSRHLRAVWPRHTTLRDSGRDLLTIAAQNSKNS
jgi:DNA-binding transcriptional LysR family regulator